MRIGNVELTPEKAVIIENTAIIADLHLGFENVMQDYGVAFPRMQIRDIIANTRKILKKYDIERLIIAGDLKHEFSRNLPYEWEDVEAFLKAFSGVKIEVIRGNHDNFLAAILAKHGIELKESIDVGGWTVVHGHKECEAERIIMGHEHPAVKIRKGGLYSFPCYLHVKGEREIIVLPAFSPLMSGSDVLNIDSFLSPILHVNADDVEVYAVDEEVVYLGKVRDLRRVVGSLE
ncbi:metallophosphoesterase [Archaeoglobus veneficus]|uniref:Phosphoesterase n=1 Tax=Archaeoglobus veneficus (strain DSM 11195 / SNP6) TaxID=693661 RepID=F2KNL5_ARCVS|nr:metallophosphoesterase [Archaeoglobus veneficus]AEA46243.1 phosphoesterase [Archaeoglobus veneficus SNP6]